MSKTNLVLAACIVVMLGVALLALRRMLQRLANQLTELHENAATLKRIVQSLEGSSVGFSRPARDLDIGTRLRTESVE